MSTSANNAATQTEIERLREEVERLKATNAYPKELTFKVSEKGAVSVYGLGRFPVTLYKEQWTRLLARANNILGFINENDGYLKTKD